MDLETSNKITEIIENQIKSEWKDFNLYIEYRRSPKEYWDRLWFIIIIVWILVVIWFVLFIAVTSYISSNII